MSKNNINKILTTELNDLKQKQIKESNEKLSEQERIYKNLKQENQELTLTIEKNIKLAAESEQRVKDLDKQLLKIKEQYKTLIATDQLEKEFVKKTLEFEKINNDIKEIKFMIEKRDLFDLVYALVKTHGDTYVKNKLYDVDQVYNDIKATAKQAKSIMEEASRVWVTPAKLALELSPLIKVPPFDSSKLSELEKKIESELKNINLMLQNIINYRSYR